MGYEYDQYLLQHKKNVKEGIDWIIKNLPEIYAGLDHLNLRVLIGIDHDDSKYEKDEYDAYNAYFYGKDRSKDVITNFNKAWLKHIHRNPHHWQHWVLINDEPNEGMICIPMPRNYLIEMICDWWSFSWAKGNLFEIFEWYAQHKDHIKLHPETRKEMEKILEAIKERLLELGYDGKVGK